MTAEQCRDIVKINMMAAEAEGRIPEAIALGMTYGQIRDRIFRDLPTEEKVAAWRKMNVAEGDIRRSLESLIDAAMESPNSIPT